jgi:hypothetical protein
MRDEAKKPEHPEPIEYESIGGPIIKIVFREFELAPQFQPLANGTVGESEICDDTTTQH